MKLYKSLILTFVLLSGTLLTYAEGESKLGGVRLGYHTSRLYTPSGSYLYNTDPLDGFYIGVFRKAKLLPLLKFGYGLEYFQNGAKDRTDGSYSVGYLSIPLYVRAKVGPVFGLVGLAGNIKLSESKSGNFDTGAYGAAESFDLPAFAGLGVKFLMFSIEARYHYGLMKVGTRSIPGNSSDPTDFTTNYLQIGAAVEF